MKRSLLRIALAAILLAILAAGSYALWLPRALEWVLTHQESIVAARVAQVHLSGSGLRIFGTGLELSRNSGISRIELDGIDLRWRRREHAWWPSLEALDIDRASIVLGQARIQSQSNTATLADISSSLSRPGSIGKTLPVRAVHIGRLVVQGAAFAGRDMVGELSLQRTKRGLWALVHLSGPGGSNLETLFLATPKNLVLRLLHNGESALQAEQGFADGVLNGTLQADIPALIPLLSPWCAMVQALRLVCDMPNQTTLKTGLLRGAWQLSQPSPSRMFLDAQAKADVSASSGAWYVSGTPELSLQYRTEVGSQATVTGSIDVSQTGASPQLPGHFEGRLDLRGQWPSAPQSATISGRLELSESGKDGRALSLSSEALEWRASNLQGPIALTLDAPHIRFKRILGENAHLELRGNVDVERALEENKRLAFQGQISTRIQGIEHGKSGGVDVSLHSKEISIDWNRAMIDVSAPTVLDARRITLGSVAIGDARLTLDPRYDGKTLSAGFRLETGSPHLWATGELNATPDAQRAVLDMHVPDLPQLQSEIRRMSPAWLPEGLDIRHGQLLVHFEASKRASVALHGTVAIRDASAVYATSLADEINASASFSYDAAQIHVQTQSLHIGHLDKGVELHNLQGKLSYAAASDHPAGGQLAIKNLSGSLLGGTFQIAATQWGLADEQRLLHVKLNGISLGKFLGLQGATDLRGEGTLDADIPVVFAADGIRVATGHLRARAPGGLIQYQPQQAPAFLAGQASTRLIMDALRDYAFEELGSSIDMKADGTLKLGVQLKGIARGLENGRAVNFSLNLEDNLYDQLVSLQLAGKVDDLIEKRLRKRYRAGPQP